MEALFTVIYMTDKVFSLTCSTQKVYEEGAKDVALSALTGMNGNYIPQIQPATCSFSYVSLVITGAFGLF